MTSAKPDQTLELTWPKAILGAAMVAAAIVLKPAPTPAQEAQKACQKAFHDADAAVREKHGYFVTREGQKEIQTVIENHQACMKKTYERKKQEQPAIKEDPRP